MCLTLWSLSNFSKILRLGNQEVLDTEWNATTWYFFFIKNVYATNLSLLFENEYSWLYKVLNYCEMIAFKIFHKMKMIQKKEMDMECQELLTCFKNTKSPLCKV